MHCGLTQIGQNKVVLIISGCTVHHVSYSDNEQCYRKTASGLEMCNVNMSGFQAATKMVLIRDDSEFSDSVPEEREIFVHSQCIPSLGTTGYRCHCEPPFTEDTTHPMPNCFKLTGPCDERLCLHGTCVASSGVNATSICVCNPGYDGSKCDHRVSFVDYVLIHYYLQLIRYC